MSFLFILDLAMALNLSKMSKDELKGLIPELVERTRVGGDKARKRAKGDFKEAIFWWLRKASREEITEELAKGERSLIPAEERKRVDNELKREQEYLRAKNLAENPCLREEQRKTLNDFVEKQQSERFPPHMGSFLFVEGWTREVFNGTMIHSMKTMERMSTKMREKYLSVVEELEKSIG